MKRFTFSVRIKKIKRMLSKSPYRGSDRERVKKGAPLLYNLCFKNVIKTEVCPLKRSNKPTDFVRWLFTDEWKLFRSHFVLGFMERCLSYMKKYLQKKQGAVSHFRPWATKPFFII